MSEPTTIIVGFGVSDDEQCAYDDLPTRYGRGKFKCFSAGYEYHDEGPEFLVGIEVASTWNDAINIDGLQGKIETAKAAVEEKFSKPASTWVLGHQT
jgi:hypothetical protein